MRTDIGICKCEKRSSPCQRYKIFCQKIRKQKLDDEFWRSGISFYLDGKGFQYKSNPYDNLTESGPFLHSPGA